MLACVRTLVCLTGSMQSLGGGGGGGGGCQGLCDSILCCESKGGETCMHASTLWVAGVLHQVVAGCALPGAAHGQPQGAQVVQASQGRTPLLDRCSRSINLSRTCLSRS